MIRLRRTEGVVVDSPQDEGCPDIWIPAPRIREDRPRFHEDKLRGNDPPEADWESEGVPQISL